MLVWFTNAHPEVRGQPIAINSEEVIAVFDAKRRQNEEEGEVDVCAVVCAREVIWDVLENSATVVEKLNAIK